MLSRISGPGTRRRLLIAAILIFLIPFCSLAHGHVTYASPAVPDEVPSTESEQEVPAAEDPEAAGEETPEGSEASSEPDVPPAPAGETANSTITLVFVGDILLNGTVGDLIKREGPMAPWEGVKDLLSAADFAIGNLECAVGSTGDAIPGKEWTFRADPATLAGLKGAGIDVVSLANNHTLDFGIECMLETVDQVRAVGISTAGAGANRAAAREPVILEKDGVRVGILATNMIYPDYAWAAGDDSPGQAIDSSRWYPEIIADIRSLSQQVDVVAVYVHWSAERQEVPEAWVLPVAKAMREAGAQIIMGSHPHILNGFDYDGRNITAYSLGNFVFSTRPEMPRLQIGAVVEVTVSKNGVESASVKPTRIVWGKTIVEQGPERLDTLRWLSGLSGAWNTDVDDNGNILPIFFSDMRGHWALASVNRLATSGAIDGYPDGTFRPEAAISKGEFAALFARAIAAPEHIQDTPVSEEFSICTEDSWAFPYLNYLAANGLIPPGDSGWAPSSPCSRLDVLSVMKAQVERQAPETTLAPPTDSLAGSFSDLSGLDEAAIDTASWAIGVGLLRGYEDGTLRLNGTVKRCEMAELLCRYLDLMPAASATPAAEPVEEP